MAHASRERRFATTVEDGRVHVHSVDGRVDVGALDAILELLGGPAWTIEYSDWERERYPALDTTDEGLTVDVVDTIGAMTHREAFVEALAAQPAESVDGGPSPRTGLFLGALLGALQHGVP